jgi:hypothetical protein
MNLHDESMRTASWSISERVPSDVSATVQATQGSRSGKAQPKQVRRTDTNAPLMRKAIMDS